ncbi:hypothetical protein RI054_24g102820 [Pseudoscourfieldia marina]
MLEAQAATVRSLALAMCGHDPNLDWDDDATRAAVRRMIYGIITACDSAFMARVVQPNSAMVNAVAGGAIEANQLNAVPVIFSGAILKRLWVSRQCSFRT